MNEMRHTRSLLFVALASLLGLGACQQEPAYKITGLVDLPQFEGSKAYLQIGGWQIDTLRMDSTIITNGKYEFKGTVTEPEYACVILADKEDWQKNIYCNLALENAEIQVITDVDGWTIAFGTPNVDEYQQYLDAKRGPQEQLTATVNAVYADRANPQLPAEEVARLQADWDRLRNEVQSLTYNQVLAHINNPAFWGDIYNCGMRAGLEQQKALLAAANERVRGLEVMQSIQERVNTLERTAVGQPFIDLKMSDPDGNPVALSDFAGKGKYILIDFWASWCAPCRAEMPEVKAAYAKYKAKGFDIVGVSFDRNHDAWVKAIKDLDLPWHHMSDLKHWESEGAKQYAVSGIPHTVLLDPQGTIIALDLRGEELQAKLAELLDK